MYNMFHNIYVLFLLYIVLLSLIVFLHDSRGQPNHVGEVITHMALLQRLLHQTEMINQSRVVGYSLGTREM